MGETNRLEMWHTNLQGDVHGQSDMIHHLKWQQIYMLSLYKDEFDRWCCHFIFFLTYMREILWTTLHPKRQLCWESQEYFGKGVSQSRKRGVSFSGSSKVCPLFANFFWSTNIYHLPIFISSHCPTLSHIETKIQVSFPTSSPLLGAFCSPPPPTTLWNFPFGNQSWAPPTSLTSLKGYGHTSSNLRP